MSDESERREGNLSIERRVDQLDFKVDRVGDKIERVGDETKSAIEMLIKQQDERWKWFEDRSDMESRNQKQAIELLTSSTVRLQQDVSSLDTQVDMIETDQKVSEAKLVEQKANADLVHKQLADSIATISENLRWVTRAVVGIVFAVIASVVAYFITH